MKKTKAYYLSEEIDPILWESVSDAYNDLSIYAYHFIESPSNKYRIPEELVGDAVLIACERAFKYRYNFNIKVSKLHNWINKIIENVLKGIYNKLPDEQSLDTIIYKTSECESECDLNPKETERKEGDNIGGIGASPEQSMLIEEVQRIKKEVADALKDHIDHLKPLDREIFIKAYVDDIPYKVIAAETGLTETAARKRAFDIKNRIRHRLPEITPWRPCDMVLYNRIKRPIPIRPILAEVDILFKLYPQYDTSKFDEEDTYNIEDKENLSAVHELLSYHLEDCLDDYIDQAEEGTDVYSELKAELGRRGWNIREDEHLSDNMFIIEDDLDLIVSGPGNPVLYIGFIYDFITIYTDETSAKSIADFIDDLHSLIDRMGDEIDSLIDIKY
jgi:RNA polymerase sigma factor (sigma-70 family)